MDTIYVCVLYTVFVRALTDGSPVQPEISEYLFQGNSNDDTITSTEVTKESLGELPNKVPLVMRMLLEEAENNMPQLSKLTTDNNQFKALAKSVSPTVFEQDGSRRILLEYPSLRQFGQQMANGEAWLVLSVNENYLQQNECDQVVNVYQTTQWDANLLQSIPLKNYSVPFIEVNITDIAKWHRRNRLHFVVTIEDSTSYSSDDINLKNFSDLFFCSLPDASEIFVLDRTEHTPVLILISEELAGRNSITAATNRTKRETSDIDISETRDEETPGNSENCRLVEWITTTEELGWEWLIYPERIPINLCIGACPSPLLDRRFNSTSHAVARDFYRTLKGMKSEADFPAPCCVPRRYRPIAMLIQTSMFSISLETSNDLSASRCGCR